MTNMNQPSSFPTTSDISAMMQELGYQWSNEAQTYYDFNFEHISRKSAERIYKYLIGAKPFSALRADKLEPQ